MKHTLEALHLKKVYNGKAVVKDVSFSLESGQIVGLLGPNGAGKTTAFYMVLGLIMSNKGKILLDKKNISRLPIHARAKLGISYLPQEASIFRKLTVSENIMAILELNDRLTSDQRKEKLNQLLEEFHIAHIKDNLGLSLSGGERRRTEIARTLATDPKFILLDEPFAGVDPISIIDIKHIIKHLAERNIGILITDHNVRETLDTCEFAYIANAGEIICEGEPSTILENKQVRDVYLGEDFSL